MKQVIDPSENSHLTQDADEKVPELSILSDNHSFKHLLILPLVSMLAGIAIVLEAGSNGLASNAFLWVGGFIALGLVQLLMHLQVTHNKRKRQTISKDLDGTFTNLLSGAAIALLIGIIGRHAQPSLHFQLASPLPDQGALVIAGHHHFIFALLVGLSLLSLRLFSKQPTAFFAFSAPAFIALLVSQLSTGTQPFEILGTLLITSIFSGMILRPSKAAMKGVLAEKEVKSLAGYIKRAQQKIRFLNGQLNEQNRQRKLLENQLRQEQSDLESNIAERTRELSETNELLNQQIKLRQNISDALAKSQARLSQAIDASKLGLWDWDLAGDRVYQSQFLNCFGPKDWTTQSYISHIKSICQSDDFIRLKSAMLDYLRGESEYFSVSYRVHDKETDSWIWVEDQGKAVRHDKNKRVLRMLGTRRNITRERKREEQLHLAKSVFDQTSDGIFVLDNKYRFVSANNAFKQITGSDDANLLKKDWLAFSNTPQKQKIFKQARLALAKEGQWEAEIFERRKDGDYFPMRMQVNSIRDASGEVGFYAGIISDQTARKEKDEKLQYLLNYDELTGLTNRTQFKDRMHNALLRARNGLERFALIYIDIDRFKHINQSLGHDKADMLLKLFASRLAGAMNKADTIARLGDDEFAVIVQAKDEDTAATQAQAILLEITKPFIVECNELRISSSLGVTLFPKNARELPLIMRQAELATRQAKYLGGNNTQFYSDKLQDFSKFRLSVESDLRKALANDELEVYYQPKLNLQNNQIESVEALVRWNHPHRGLIVPSDFVNIAEESGLIAELGADVLRSACKQAQQWRQDNIGDIKVSVNLSAHQLRQGHFVNTVYQILSLTGLPPFLLELELTESSIIENVNATAELLQEFCALGIGISVDDFGTGYSSFGYLKKLPVDTLKIDRMFVRDLHHSADDAAICKAIIVLGQNLNLQVVAEGVENEEQMRFLRSEGCDMVQGFLVSHPLNATDMTALLNKQKATNQARRQAITNADY
ncbi:MAG: EAL domain-containing protein [Hahellaceae bacterium]|nr:EAL domain-containing protein [Hahellaceae bacterium]MCP5210707.1 EAL domain-containing protein [Hahellaceae bacterium]